MVGGWDFVWAAYGVSLGGLALYALLLWQRRCEALKATKDESL